MKKTVSLILILTIVLQALLLLTSCEINVTFPDVEQKTEQASKNDSDTKDGTASDLNATEGIADSPKYGKVSADINGYKYNGEYYMSLPVEQNGGSFISVVNFNDDGTIEFGNGERSYVLTFDENNYPTLIKQVGFEDNRTISISWNLNSDSMPESVNIDVTNSTGISKEAYKYKLEYDKAFRLAGVELTDSSEREPGKVEIKYNDAGCEVYFNGKTKEEYSYVMDVFYYQNLSNRDIKTDSDGSYYYDLVNGNNTVKFRLFKLTEEQAIKYHRLMTIPVFNYDIVETIESAHKAAAYQNALNAYQNFLIDYDNYEAFEPMVFYINSGEFWFVKKSGKTSPERLDEKPSLDGFKILESHSNEDITIYVPNDFKVK